MADISLALGGGGIKGIAHIGVLKVLVKAGLNIRAISGTSAGGIAGAIFSAGYSPDEMVEIIRNMTSGKMFDRRPGDGPSLLGMGGILNNLEAVLKERTFDDVLIPFACTAVDNRSAREIILTQGRLLDALEATAAVPGVFPPKELGPYELVDGGILDPVPVSLARWLAPTLPVIAVCLSPIPDEWANTSDFHFPETTPIPQPIKPIINQISRMRISQSLQIFIRSMDITAQMLTELRLQVDTPDVIIRPDVSKYGILDNVPPEELIRAGETAAEAALPEIRTALSWQKQLSRRFRSANLPGVMYSPSDSDSIHQNSE